MAINTVARKSSRTTRTTRMTRTTREVRRERSAGRQEHISFEELAGCYIGEYADFGDFLYAEPITILKVPRPSAQIESAGVIEKDMMFSYEVLSLNTVVQMTAGGNYLYLIPPPSP